MTHEELVKRRRREERERKWLAGGFVVLALLIGSLALAAEEGLISEPVACAVMVAPAVAVALWGVGGFIAWLWQENDGS